MLNNIGQDLVAGSCECNNKPSAFIKGREFVGQLSDWQLFNKYSDSWSQFNFSS